MLEIHLEIQWVTTTLSDYRDSLLKFSSKSFDLGLELEVIEEQNKVGKSEEEDADNERQDRELCRLQCEG